MKTFKSKVCVCGAGPAGFIAAIASARTGADTILLEKYGFPGGMATAGLVGPISKFNFEKRRVVGGIPLEFIERLHAAGGAIIDLPSGNIPFDSEIYKLTAMEMLLEAGVKIFFHATIHGSKLSNANKMVKVLASSEGTTIELEADYFIDCTGTGSIIAEHQELWSKRNCTHENQPLSLIFKLGGVDTSQMTTLMAEDGVKYANAQIHEELLKAVSDNLISGFGGPWNVWGSAISDACISVNCTRYGGDVTDPEDFTKAEVQMRREIMPLIKIFKKVDPAYSNCFLQETAVTAGYRESRELNALYRVSVNDIFDGKKHTDTVAYGAHPVDRHLPGCSGQSVQFLSAPYSIPYRCLVSNKCSNLFAAGALAAAEPTAFATMRVQAQCMAMGHAAGAAAALCAITKVNATELSSEKLRNILNSQKAII